MHDCSLLPGIYDLALFFLAWKSHVQCWCSELSITTTACFNSVLTLHERVDGIDLLFHLNLKTILRARYLLSSSLYLRRNWSTKGFIKWSDPGGQIPECILFSYFATASFKFISYPHYWTFWWYETYQIFQADQIAWLIVQAHHYAQI